MSLTLGGGREPVSLLVSDREVSVFVYNQAAIWTEMGQTGTQGEQTIASIKQSFHSTGDLPLLFV